MNRFCQPIEFTTGCRGETAAQRHHHRSMLRKILCVLFAASLMLVGCLPIEAQPEQQYARLIDVEPSFVQPGTLIVVRGTEWRPNENLFINLESLPFGNAASGTFAVTNADAEGNFAISFYYPQTSPWNQQEAVRLTARPRRDEASTSIILSVVPPPTPTAPTVPTAAPTATATPTPVRPTNVARVTTDHLNVRQGPSTAYPVLAVVDVGTELSVLGQSADGEWLRVRLRNAREGWVAREFTDFRGTAVVVSAPPLVIVTSPPLIFDWRGEYYANGDLRGSPLLVRNDGAINFDWGFSAPSERLPADNFSVRWTRTLNFPAGSYRFFARSDDGVRVWIDNTLVIDQWREHSAQTHTADLTLNAGSHHLRVEYFEGGGRAEIELWWERIGDFPQWRGEYFNNERLAGQPLVVRNDAEVNFDWQRGSPAAGISPENFSVRWTRSLHFSAGLYRFHARMDDGLRLFIDGNSVIEQWRDGGAREAVADLFLAEGTHALRVEYYERFGDATARVWWEKLDSQTEFPDWKGEYWSNRNLNGNSIFIRNDRAVNFNWGGGSPATGIPADNFSARWTRRAHFDSGTYRFHLTVDDGARVWIDDQRIIDEWRNGTSREIVVDRMLSSGSHNLRVDYYENDGGAAINFWWERVQTPGDFPDWKGEYWSNQDLRGSPFVTRNDPAIDFRWGTNPPARDMPNDHFSARWTRRVRFEPGVYRFHLRADDGVRLFIDDERVLDEWHDSLGNEVYTVDRSLDGQHKLTLEYYENTGGSLVEFWWQRVEPTTPTPTFTPTSTATHTPTPLICPTATPQPLWVDPVTSPTDKLAQTIVVYLGDGEEVTVTSESGTFRASGSFDAASNPARVEIPLLPNTLHQLTVSGRVKQHTIGGCTVGGYTLSTSTDRNGVPLMIQQQTASTATDTPTPAPPPPTDTPTPEPVPPTDTPEPVPPTDTPTPEPVPPTETPTPEPVPPTDTPVPEPDTPTPTATICPQATPEPIFVEPVDDQTDDLSQIITVYLGNGETVTVTSESGVFTVSGAFDAVANPAQVEIALLPDTTHHLTVSGRVKETSVNGCSYGGYVISTQTDRNGQPLIIEQD